MRRPASNRAISSVSSAGFRMKSLAPARRPSTAWATVPLRELCLNLERSVAAAPAVEIEDFVTRIGVELDRVRTALTIAASTVSPFGRAGS